jgi:hypothetical protein
LVPLRRSSVDARQTTPTRIGHHGGANAGDTVCCRSSLATALQMRDIAPAMSAFRRKASRFLS